MERIIAKVNRDVAEEITSSPVKTVATSSLTDISLAGPVGSTPASPSISDHLRHSARRTLSTSLLSRKSSSGGDLVATGEAGSKKTFSRPKPPAAKPKLTKIDTETATSRSRSDSFVPSPAPSLSDLRRPGFDRSFSETKNYGLEKLPNEFDTVMDEIKKKIDNFEKLAKTPDFDGKTVTDFIKNINDKLDYLKTIERKQENIFSHAIEKVEKQENKTKLAEKKVVDREAKLNVTELSRRLLEEELEKIKKEELPKLTQLKRENKKLLADLNKRDSQSATTSSRPKTAATTPTLTDAKITSLRDELAKTKELLTTAEENVV